MTTTRQLFDLSSKRAVVTGAAGLLGRVFVAALSELGAEVHLLDLSTEMVDLSAERLSASGSGIVHHNCDLRDEDAVESTFSRIGDTGTLDILVNSAAIDPKVPAGQPGHRPGRLTDYPLELWKQSLDVNLTGMFLATRACCRTMERQGDSGRGSIVNISSTYGLRGPDQRIYESAGDDSPFVKPVDYPTTKAGVLGFTRAVAAMYRGTEIRVNALTPGGAFNGQDDDFVANYSAKTLLGRMAHPDDYRGAIAFLCSDASAYMTGANLVVDGGWTAS